MIQFQCDYNEGCHPAILQRLVETNMQQTVGYGYDGYCQEACALIRKACNAPDADVHFLVGGTQANTTVISSILRPHQGVIAAESGHINVHETGAIEHTGHKVITLPTSNGKICASDMARYLRAFYAQDEPEHMVQPGMVYISFPTELGTLYSKHEIADIQSVCKQYALPLFIDGARLGYGLCSPECDLTLCDLATLCDVFYIGGTKVGALFGEAVVIMNKSLTKDFRYFIKQQGGMLAKGRLLGIQFSQLFTDDLYLKISRHAIDMAMLIKASLIEKGYRFFVDSPTNQQFPILPNELLKKISRDFLLSSWESVDDNHTAVRICTSWGTKPEAVQALIDALPNLKMM